MKIYHSTNIEISEIHQRAENWFGGCSGFLFFLRNFSAGYGNLLYAIELEESSIMSDVDLDFAFQNTRLRKRIAGLIQEVESCFGVGSEKVLGILKGSHPLVGERYFKAQVLKGQVSLALGFEGCEIEDEFSGESVMVYMVGRESELVTENPAEVLVAQIDFERKLRYDIWRYCEEL